jgi:hypothetical protein
MRTGTPFNEVGPENCWNWGTVSRLCIVSLFIIMIINWKIINSVHSHIDTYICMYMLRLEADPIVLTVEVKLKSVSCE